QRCPAPSHLLSPPSPSPTLFRSRAPRAASGTAPATATSFPWRRERSLRPLPPAPHGRTPSRCRRRAPTGSPWALGADIAMAFDQDRKSTRLNSSHVEISYAVFCL